MGTAGNDWIYRKKIIKEFKVKKSSLETIDKLVKEDALTYKQYYETLNSARNVGKQLSKRVGALVSSFGKVLSDFAKELEEEDIREAHSGTENQ